MFGVSSDVAGFTPEEKQGNKRETAECLNTMKKVNDLYATSHSSLERRPIKLEM